MIVADKDVTLILTGNGDVLEPEDGVAAIGSGGNYALAAARALVEYETDAEVLCRKAMGDRRRALRLHQRPPHRRDDGQRRRNSPPLRGRGRGWVRLSFSLSTFAASARPTPNPSLSGRGKANKMNDHLTPKTIVAALDAHIIGQAAAKRAVAVAMRNRWRRQQLCADLRDEVTPKNILMIGPTGCGKTEISRRLAKLADAPFVKVEATKFTEVGYVGRDVEQIARDLVEEAIRLEKERRRIAVKDKAEEAAMARLLDALIGKDSSAATRESFKQRFHDGHLERDRDRDRARAGADRCRSRSPAARRR